MLNYKAMNILHIASSYFDRGLYKVFFSNLRKIGFENIIYVPRWNNNYSIEQSGIYMIDKKYSKVSKFLYWGQQKYIYDDISRRIDLSQIDILHIHRLFYGGYAARKIKERYNIPYVVTIRNSDIYQYLKYRITIRNHACKIMLGASKVIFISKAYQDYVLGNFVPKKYIQSIKEKSVVLTNGIDDIFLENKQNPKRKIIDKNIKLICVAEISNNKNQLTIVKACKELIQKGYEVKLTLIGKVIDERYFHKLENENMVKYYPYCSKEEIIEHLRNADIFVMPSKHETFRLVYAEAISQGLPVIYTRNQGFDGQYQDGKVGYSVQYNNYYEVADKIMKICDDYYNISVNCVNYADAYSWSHISQKYKKIYDQSVLVSRY